jgi:hypothetical protein
MNVVFSPDFLAGSGSKGFRRSQSQSFRATALCSTGGELFTDWSIIKYLAAVLKPILIFRRLLQDPAACGNENYLCLHGAVYWIEHLF